MFGSLLFPVNFYAVLDVTRIIGIAIIAISLPLLWWRFRHTDREALIGIALVMRSWWCCSSLPRCRGTTPGRWRWWPRWRRRRQAIALIAGLSTWITVIWKPDGAHGMYSWIHVLLATACAAVAWYSLYKAPEWADASGQYAIAWARRTTSRA